MVAFLSLTAVHKTIVRVHEHAIGSATTGEAECVRLLDPRVHPVPQTDGRALFLSRTGRVVAGTASPVTSAAGHDELEISLKYYEGTPVIRELSRVSKPGRRVYASVKEIPLVRNGLGVSIVSTPKGVMSDAAARNANVGGEVLCTVF